MPINIAPDIHEQVICANVFIRKDFDAKVGNVFATMEYDDKKQSMVLLRQKTQEARDQLTSLMILSLREKDHDVAEQSLLVKQHQQQLEEQEKKNLSLETDLRSSGQQVVVLEKKLQDSGQKALELTLENTDLKDALTFVKKQANEFKHEAVTQKKLCAEAEAKSALVEEEAKMSIEETINHFAQERAALASEQAMLVQLLDRQRTSFEEEKQALLELKTKLMDKSALLKNEASMPSA